MTTDTHDRRLAAAGLALTAVGMIVLFGTHPGPGGGNFRELMQAEVRDQARNLGVHCGFILIEALSLTSFLMLAKAYAHVSARVTAACVALAFGVAALTLSMLVDGVVVPSLAVRYLEAASGMEAEGLKGSLTFCSALIGTLMPVGLAFQALSIGSWSLVFARVPGRPRVVGIIGLLSSTTFLAVVTVSHLRPPAHAVFGAIVMLIVWHVAAATAVWTAPKKG